MRAVCQGACVPPICQQETDLMHKGRAILHTKAGLMGLKYRKYIGLLGHVRSVEYGAGKLSDFDEIVASHLRNPRASQKHQGAQPIKNA